MTDIDVVAVTTDREEDVDDSNSCTAVDVAASGM
jgi:hypothetical protein